MEKLELGYCRKKGYMALDMADFMGDLAIKCYR